MARDMNEAAKQLAQALSRAVKGINDRYSSFAKGIASVGRGTRRDD